MNVRHIEPEDADQWLSMRLALWPETDRQRHRKEMAMMTSDADRYAVFVCEDHQGSLIGFAEIALREWAEGCLTSPVAYLEGWYVAQCCRGRGAGSALLSAAEAWARYRGCSEMASDTNIGNAVSEAAHLHRGFQVAASVVAFRKAL